MSRTLLPEYTRHSTVPQEAAHELTGQVFLIDAIRREPSPQKQHAPLERNARGGAHARTTMGNTSFEFRRHATSQFQSDTFAAQTQPLLDADENTSGEFNFLSSANDHHRLVGSGDATFCPCVVQLWRRILSGGWCCGAPEAVTNRNLFTQAVVARWQHMTTQFSSIFWFSTNSLERAFAAQHYSRDLYTTAILWAVILAVAFAGAAAATYNGNFVGLRVAMWEAKLGVTLSVVLHVLALLLLMRGRWVRRLRESPKNPGEPGNPTDSHYWPWVAPWLHVTSLELASALSVVGIFCFLFAMAASKNPANCDSVNDRTICSKTIRNDGAVSIAFLIVVVGYRLRPVVGVPLLLVTSLVYLIFYTVVLTDPTLALKKVTAMLVSCVLVVAFSSLFLADRASRRHFESKQRLKAEQRSSETLRQLYSSIAGSMLPQEVAVVMAQGHVARFALSSTREGSAIVLSIGLAATPMKTILALGPAGLVVSFQRTVVLVDSVAEDVRVCLSKGNFGDHHGTSSTAPWAIKITKFHALGDAVELCFHNELRQSQSPRQHRSDSAAFSNNEAPAIGNTSVYVVAEQSPHWTDQQPSVALRGSIDTQRAAPVDVLLLYLACLHDRLRSREQDAKRKWWEGCCRQVSAAAAHPASLMSRGYLEAFQKPPQNKDVEAQQSQAFDVPLDVPAGVQPFVFTEQLVCGVGVGVAVATSYKNISNFVVHGDAPQGARDALRTSRSLLSSETTLSSHHMQPLLHVAGSQNAVHQALASAVELRSSKKISGEHPVTIVANGACEEGESTSHASTKSRSPATTPTTSPTVNHPRASPTRVDSFSTHEGREQQPSALLSWATLQRVRLFSRVNAMETKYGAIATKLEHKTVVWQSMSMEYGDTFALVPIDVRPGVLDFYPAEPEQAAHIDGEDTMPPHWRTLKEEGPPTLTVVIPQGPTVSQDVVLSPAAPPSALAPTPRVMTSTQSTYGSEGAVMTAALYNSFGRSSERRGPGNPLSCPSATGAQDCDVSNLLDARNHSATRIHGGSSPSHAVRALADLDSNFTWNEVSCPSRFSFLPEWFPLRQFSDEKEVLYREWVCHRELNGFGGGSPPFTFAAQAALGVTFLASFAVDGGYDHERALLLPFALAGAATAVAILGFCLGLSIISKSNVPTPLVALPTEVPPSVERLGDDNTSDHDKQLQPQTSTTTPPQLHTSPQRCSSNVVMHGCSVVDAVFLGIFVAMYVRTPADGTSVIGSDSIVWVSTMFLIAGLRERAADVLLSSLAEVAVAVAFVTAINCRKSTRSLSGVEEAIAIFSCVGCMAFRWSSDASRRHLFANDEELRRVQHLSTRESQQLAALLQKMIPEATKTVKGMMFGKLLELVRAEEQKRGAITPVTSSQIPDGRVAMNNGCEHAWYLFGPSVAPEEEQKRLRVAAAVCDTLLTVPRHFGFRDAVFASRITDKSFLVIRGCVTSSALPKATLTQTLAALQQADVWMARVRSAVDDVRGASLVKTNGDIVVVTVEAVSSASEAKLNCQDECLLLMAVASRFQSLSAIDESTSNVSSRCILTSGPVISGVLGTAALTFEYFGEPLEVAWALLLSHRTELFLWRNAAQHFSCEQDAPPCAPECRCSTTVDLISTQRFATCYRGALDVALLPAHFVGVAAFPQPRVQGSLHFARNTCGEVALHDVPIQPVRQSSYLKLAECELDKHGFTSRLLIPRVGSADASLHHHPAPLSDFVVGTNTNSSRGSVASSCGERLGGNNDQTTSQHFRSHMRIGPVFVHNAYSVTPHRKVPPPVPLPRQPTPVALHRVTALGQEVVEQEFFSRTEC